MSLGKPNSMEQRVCFVISPIGEKDSDIRKHADDLYDLVVEPALEKYGFHIIRADKISSVASITAEIVELVQNADLCVIDITGHNANVMYECGRRHETGRPYIMVAKSGEKLPFDITTIRTIFYDLSDGRQIREAVKAVQGIVDKMMVDGFAAHSSGESLASISDALKRIEKKLRELDRPVGMPGAAGPVSNPGLNELLKSLGPVGAFNYALTQRDEQLAEALIPRLEANTPRDKLIKAVYAQAAAMGSRLALGKLEGELDYIIENFDLVDKLTMTGAYVAALALHDEEERGLGKLGSFYKGILAGGAGADDLSQLERGQCLNQYQKLLYGTEQYEEAAKVGEEVVKLIPDEPSFYYNLSIDYEYLSRNEDSLAAVDAYMGMLDRRDNADIEPEHLRRAVEVYAKSGKRDKAQRAFARLQRVNPYRAAIVAEDDDVKRALT